jgi:hypothetical protein
VRVVEGRIHRNGESRGPTGAVPDEEFILRSGPHHGPNFGTALGVDIDASYRKVNVPLDKAVS